MDNLGSNTSQIPNILKPVKAYNTSWLTSLCLLLFVSGIILMALRLNALGIALSLGGLAGTVLSIAIIQYQWLIGILGGIFTIVGFGAILLRIYKTNKNNDEKDIAVKDLVNSIEAIKPKIKKEIDEVKKSFNAIQSKTTKDIVKKLRQY